MAYSKPKQENIRNVAIIAHVDHGKTTLVDAFLKQTEVFRDNQEEMSQSTILDTGDLEKEKGITIKAKNISVRYKDYKINIVDTPGHADFGGEVERTLNMADGCILLVDAQEGPMPQTKFVLKKALELGFKPIVVLNKIDKPHAYPEKTIDKVNDLILSLATEEDQLEFPIFYAVAKNGTAFTEIPDNPANAEGTIKPLLDGIIEHIPSPSGDEKDPFQMQITSLEFDAHSGTYLVGKIKRGSLKVGDSVVVLESDEEDAKKVSGKVKKILVREGLESIETDQAFVGEIISIGGIESKAIGGTVCSPQKLEALPVIKISNPSVRMKFEANTSPLVGKEGEFVTARLLQNRLEKEIETNISLSIEKAEGGYYVSGRGELQLEILIEELRREGFEFQVRKPEIIFQTIDGVKSEPREELYIEVPSEFEGTVIKEVSERKAELMNMESDSDTGNTKFEYQILTRNLIGLRNSLLTQTKGNLIMNNFLLDYVPYKKQEDPYRKGVLISSDNGVAAEYALNTIQERGDIFIKPATKVYEGMIIGINKYDNDLEVNPTKERAKSGVRRNQAEVTQVSLKSLKPLTLEFAMTFLGKDELLEVTPKSLRLRKVHLTKTQRDWAKRGSLTDFAKSQMNN